MDTHYLANDSIPLSVESRLQFQPERHVRRRHGQRHREEIKEVVLPSWLLHQGAMPPLLPPTPTLLCSLGGIFCANLGFRVLCSHGGIFRAGFILFSVLAAPPR